MAPAQNASLLSETVEREMEVSGLLGCAVLVMTMQGGFAFLECGTARNLNAVNIMFKNFSDLVFGIFAWWACGWAFAFGKSAGGFIGASQFFPDTDLDYTAWFFQLSFAATAATIDSGAVIERMKLSVYIAMSVIMTGWTYPVVCHWVWHSEGWLYKQHVIDLAGSGVVHLLGGTSALVCAYMIGPRLGFLGRAVPSDAGFESKHVIATHRVFLGEPVQQLFGTLLLFFGWFGFNCGSAWGMENVDRHFIVGHVAFTTALGAGFGAIVGMIYSVFKLRFAHPGMCTGALLSGLVSVTAAPHCLPGWGAALSGGIGAILAIKSVEFFERLKIDDPVGVLPVHFVAGIWGLLAPGFFAHMPTKNGVEQLHLEHVGLFFGGGITLLRLQTFCSLAIIAWGALNTFAFWLFTERVLKVKCRISPVQELVGNDVCEHGVDLISRLKATKDFQRIIATFMQSRMRMEYGSSRIHPVRSSSSAEVM